MKFKIRKNLTQTNIGFPAEWEGLTTEEDCVKISYRYGKINIFVNDKLEETTEKDQYDVGGAMETDELLQILERDELLEE